MTANDNIYLGPIPAQQSQPAVEGEALSIGGESFYKIANYDQMRPFFMSVVSSSNHWMFISSTGDLYAFPCLFFPNMLCM